MALNPQEFDLSQPGPNWRPIADPPSMAIVDTPATNDLAAAAVAVHQQMQSALRKALDEVARVSAGLANTASWSGLSANAADLLAIIALDPLEVPGRLGDAYPLMLSLGEYLEADNFLRVNPNEDDNPLSVNQRRALSHAIRIGAPLLRNFPTIAQWDDQAGRMLERPELFISATELLRIAHKGGLISDRDATRMSHYVEAAKAEGFLGEKAGRSLLGSMRKFAVRTAFHVAMLYSGAMSSEFANHSILVHKVVPVLRAAERQVVDMANGLPEDLRQAFLELMAESHRLAAADPTDLPGLMPELSELPIPEDVEAQARDLILAGHAVPPHWVPAIRALNFGRTNLADATLLATLGNLQELSLNNTPVTDIAPLAALGNLQALYLNNTPVTDIAPLAALGKLRELDIQGTRVRDVSPLAHLRNLKIIGP